MEVSSSPAMKTQGTISMPGRLCRLCANAEEDGKLTYIFTESDEYQDNLADVINIVLPVKVSQMDSLPKQICEICTEKLLATQEFVLSCIAAESELEDLCDTFESKISSVEADGFDSDMKNDSTCLFENESGYFTDPKKCHESENSLKCINNQGDDSQDNLKDACLSDCPSSSQSFRCPLCCEGEMGACSEEPIELNLKARDQTERSFEEQLMIQYRQANEEDDSSSSVVEEDFDSDGGLNELKGTDMPENENDPALLEGTGRNEQQRTRKKTKKFRGRKKRQQGKYKRVVSGSRGGKEESDTLIWIKADNEQSIPLVQCIHCCGWLPGYASCLQHSLTNHVDVSESDVKTFHCARCEVISVSSPSDLVSHFTSIHCPGHDFDVDEDDGQFIVIDKSQPKWHDNERDITYYCSICEKGFSWLLNLLRHSCSQVNCNDMYCSVCDQQYRNRQRFVFHMNFHSEKAPLLQCDVCSQSFEDDCLLYNHVRFAHVTENVVCSECGKYFRSEKGLASHQLSAHNSDPSARSRHKCTVCGKCYRDKQGLNEHIVTHLSEKPFPCDKCDRAYNRYSRLKQHQMSHVYTENMDCYECSVCGLAFPDVDKAFQHSTSEGHEVQTAVLSKVFRCEFCDTVFSCPEGLNQHRPSHVGEKPFVCQICGSSFHTYSRVTTHKTTHGIYDQIEPLEGDFTIPRHFLCEHCGVSYPYWSYLQTHRKMRHSENPYALSCKLCPEKFKNSWSVVYHRKKVHDQNGAIKEWRKRSLQCPHCGVTCMYQHTLSLHIERKHGSLKEDGEHESYQCEECGKVFKYQSSLHLHQKMHTGQKNFQCEECEKTFLTTATLRNHTKRCHQGIKPYQCEYCGKAFFHRISRDDHLRVHTGEKPFECQFCEKRFRLKSMLADHSKIHSDHRPYPCDVCGSSFRRMVHMKQHRMLHTGEKPFQCKLCGQDFRLKQELQRHMKTKHGESSVEIVEEDEFIFAD